jgi:hypothetical protein
MFFNSLSTWFHDDYLFFVYGLLSGYFFHLWHIVKQKFPLAGVLLYTHGLWLVVIVVWIAMQLNSILAWCVFAGGIFFTHLVPLPRISLSYFKQRHSETQWQKQARKWREQRAREHRAYQHQAEFKRWEEQFRREQAAKAYQAWQENIRQKQNARQEYPPQHNLQNLQQDTRSYEEILGLSIGWTQEELKKAYQRESQRTHPDKWIGKPEALQKLMEEEYKMIQKAYKTLKRRHMLRD